ncbi:hypothetical protein PSEUDO8O_20039 [Pseudomonas sp. 8O]|nr:hypothetical protein PSEUDO8O_20039 [Pseudomonas sp. 8O]
MRDQLMGARHIDAVDVRVTYRRGCRAEVDVLRASLAGHLNDLLAGGATHDGVVHQHHVLAAELQLDGVELLPYGFLACRLAGHDEGAADVAVLDETFAEFHAQMIGQLQRRRTAGVGNRDDHVDVMIRTLTENLVGQLLAHTQTRLVHRDTVHDRVRARQVNVLEDAGRVLRVGRALTGEQLALFGDVDRLARRQVADQGEAEYVQRYALGRDHVLDALIGMALAEDDRANAVGITEADDAITGDHRHDSVSTQAALVHVGNGGEHIFFGRLQLAALGKLMGKHVEQHFRIGIGVHVTQIGLVDFLGQLLDVGQVTVVRQGDAVRRVDVERLSFGRAGATSSRVAHMADAHMTDQALHMPLLEHVTYQTIVLAQEQAAIMAGDNTGSILAAVLEDGEPVIQRLIDVRFTDDTDDATHVPRPLLDSSG